MTQDNAAKNASLRFIFDANANCYKDVKVKFGEWGKKSKLIIRIITFLLGFYVSTIFKQYRSKISTIPDAENPVLEIGGLANERTEDAFKGELVSPVGVTEWKRTMARYCLLSWTMCFNTISQPLASKLGTGDQLIEKGLLTKEELAALMVRGAVQTFFWVNLGFCPNEGGGGSRQSQLFIKIAQNLICLGTVHKCDETHST